ncbi:glycosyltransferase family protein [Geomonas oryzae]|uniref:hypothetical protein n=1 Tax=Geomonas oryzae TaxID=2364273 RepID=UPI00100B8D0D|nr:hypothetical protein [Geomonas oryzae]
MNVCLIGSSSLRYMPFIRCYEEVLQASGVSYDIVYWDRFGLDEEKENSIAFHRPGTARKAALIPGYLGYRRFLKNRLHGARYDLYVVFSAQIAVLLFGFLIDKRFVVDVRDYTYEGFLPFRLALSALFKRAMLVCISSSGYLEWLPKSGKRVISHNLIETDLGAAPLPFDFSKKVMSYIGAISYYDANVKFISQVRRLEGFEVRYIGKGECEASLEQYCRCEGVGNVKFFGQFTPEQKRQHYLDANFVVGCFGSETVNGRCTMPNRLYESCLYRRPIIVNKGTFLGEMVDKYGLGISVEQDRVADMEPELSRFYDPGYYEAYGRRCERYLATVKADLATFQQAFGSLLY